MHTGPKSFKFFDSFNLFLFSRTSDHQTHFLLRRKQSNFDFAHFRGSFNNDEPSILLALAKKFVRKTSGLLCSQNFKYFCKDDGISFDSGSIVFEKRPKGARPPKILSTATDDICRLVCESPFIFQDSSQTVTYFVEIPMLDLEKLGKFAETKGVEHQFKYFTLTEMLNNKLGEIDQSLRDTLHDQHELLYYMKKYIVANRNIEVKEFYGIICCEMFIKTYLLHALHYPIFKKHGESWRFYRAFERDLPTEDDLKKLKGLIIPGSSCSAYNLNIDWYQGLFELIRNINNNYPNINLLGICFGAQIIAQALGGRVEKMERGFIDEGQVLNVNPEFYELPYVKDSRVDSTRNLVVAQAHYDHIVELPPMAKVYASSEYTNVEIFIVNRNILAFQGHPDYNEVMIARSSLKNMKVNVRDYDKFEKAWIDNKFQYPLTQQELLKICFNFLKQGSEELSFCQKICSICRKK